MDHEQGEHITNDDLLQQCAKQYACLELQKELMAMHIEHMTGLLKCYDNLQGQIRSTWMIVKLRLLKTGGG